MQWHDEGKAVDVPKLAEKFATFETDRRQYTGQPAALIKPTKAHPTPSLRNKKMYDYIIAFKAGGAARSNLNIRNAAIKTLCR